jgi:hypothetical protein
MSGREAAFNLGITLGELSVLRPGRFTFGTH